MSYKKIRYFSTHHTILSVQWIRSEEGLTFETSLRGPNYNYVNYLVRTRVDKTKHSYQYIGVYIRSPGEGKVALKGDISEVETPEFLSHFVLCCGWQASYVVMLEQSISVGVRYTGLVFEIYPQDRFQGL